MSILDEELPVDFDTEEVIEEHDTGEEEILPVGDEEVAEESEEEQEEVPVATAIDYSAFSELGTEDEVKATLDDILGENPSEAEIKVALKFLEKAKQEEIADKEMAEQKIAEAKESIFNNPPISKQEFRALQVWVKNQPQEVQDELSDKTDFSKHSEEAIRNAILEANRLRLGTVKTIPNSKGNNTKGVKWTRENAIATYESIGTKYTGNERINKINQLKSSIAKSGDLEIKAWARGYFGN